MSLRGFRLLDETVDRNFGSLAQPCGERQRWIVAAPFNLGKMRRCNGHVPSDIGQGFAVCLSPFPERVNLIHDFL